MLCENHFYKWGKEGIKPLQKYRHFHKVSNEKEDISFKEFLENLWVLSILQEFSWDGNRSKALFMHSETLHIIRKRWEVYEINEVRVRIWQYHKWRVSVFKGSREKERAYWRRSGSSYRGITLEVERHLRLCQEGKWEGCPSPHYGLKAQHERRHAGRNRARVEKDPGHSRGGRGLWVPKKT